MLLLLYFLRERSSIVWSLKHVLEVHINCRFCQRGPALQTFAVSSLLCMSGLSQYPCTNSKPIRTYDTLDSYPLRIWSISWSLDIYLRKTRSTFYLHYTKMIPYVPRMSMSSISRWSTRSELYLEKYWTVNNFVVVPSIGLALSTCAEYAGVTGWDERSCIKYRL